MTSGIGRHVALLLAAGGSRRLGQPKQLLLRDGEPLVRRAARLLSETGPLRLLVVAGAHRHEVTAALTGMNCEIVVNPDWADGLASSLRIATDALRGIDAPVLVSTCDQPALETQHLLVLLQGASCAPSRCAALLHEDGPGVPAVMPAHWLLQQAGEMHGDRGLGQRLRALPQGALHLLDARDAAFDVDTDADRVFAVKQGWLDG